VVRTLEAPAVFPQFTHPAPSNGPRTVDLTVRLVITGDPAAFVEALREFVERVNPIPTHRPVETLLDERERPGVRIRARERTVLSGGHRVDLTRREFDLLLHLAKHPRQVFTRAQLLRAIWGDALSGDRTVDVHVARLRRKLAVPLLETVRGVGYRLSPGADLLLLP
jgi:DNA-binding response OmpR family regulator